MIALIGSIRSASAYAREHGLSRRDCVVIQRREQLQGRRDVELVWLHDAVRLPDYAGIAEYADILESMQ